MSVKITCPECDNALDVPDNYLGKTLRCTRCGQTFKARPPQASDDSDRPRKAKSRDRNDDDEVRPPSRRRYNDDDDRPRSGRRAYDDRPSRRRRDEDDEDDRRSRRRGRDDRRDGPGPKRESPNALITLIPAIGALVASFIPCFAPIGAFVGLFCVLFGIIALVVAKKTGKYKTGLLITAICCGAGAVLVGTAWTLILRSLADKPDTTVTEQQEPEQKEVADGPPLRVTAPELLRSFRDVPARIPGTFQQGRAGTPSPYEGKIVEVTGTIAPANPGAAFGGVSIHFTSEDAMVPGGVVCKFSEDDRAAVTALEPGGRVTVRGRCTGGSRLAVTVERCVLVTTGKAGAIHKSARELGAELVQDERGFHKKYSDKLMEITGPVLEVRRNADGEVEIDLDTGRGKIICTFKPANAGKTAGVAVGDEVTIRGLGFPFLNTFGLRSCTLVTK